MTANYILIKSDTGLITVYSNAIGMPGCYTEGFDWVDWRENTGTESEPVYQGKAIPIDGGEWYYKDGWIVDADGNEYVG